MHSLFVLQAGGPIQVSLVFGGSQPVLRWEPRPPKLLSPLWLIPLVILAYHPSLPAVTTLPDSPSPTWRISTASRLVSVLRSTHPRAFAAMLGAERASKTHPGQVTLLPKILQWLSTGQTLKSFTETLEKRFSALSWPCTRASSPQGPSCWPHGGLSAWGPQPVTGGELAWHPCSVPL